MSEIAVIGCSKTKAGYRCPAAEMYTGQYFRACLAGARVIAPDRVYILSAKHGLLRPSRVIDPYDLRLGRPGAVTADRLREQARTAGLLGAPVVALCGADYVKLIEQVWEDVDAPLAGLAIGRQLHELRLLARGSLEQVREQGERLERSAPPFDTGDGARRLRAAQEDILLTQVR